MKLLCNSFVSSLHVKPFSRKLLSTTKMDISVLEEKVRHLFGPEKVRRIVGSNNESGVAVPHLKIVFGFQNNSNINMLEDRYSIIQIPIGWDGSMQSLITAVKSHLPESNLHNITQVQQKLRKGIEGFGELTSATFYTDQLDPTNWMLFEKYDGVRAFWNPQQKQFISRNGNVLRMPDSIIQDMIPLTIELDGELWFGRGKFQETKKITGRSDPRTINWNDFKFMVFDIPTLKEKKYKDRYEELQQLIPSDHRFVKVAPVVKCEGKDHLDRFSKEIMKEGAEGIILRNPESMYKHGATKDFVKFKTFRDAECLVIGEGEKPSHWKCQLPDGRMFEAPIVDELKEQVKENDIVSFKYSHSSSKEDGGVQLSSAQLYRIRNDLTWDDICSDPTKFRVSPTKSPRKSVNSKPTKKEHGYWTNVNNCRQFLDAFAQSKGFDPLVPDNWYHLTRRDILEAKGSALLYRYSGSLRKALTDIYPEVLWDTSRWTKQNNWSVKQNRRNFFDEFAQAKGFDPLIPSNWYQIRYIDILELKGAGPLHRYDSSIGNALMDLYPELHWDAGCFRQHIDWANKENRRKFFDELAQSKGFDPLVPENWNRVQSRDVILCKHGNRLLKFYRGSLHNALMDVYPELNWSQHPLSNQTRTEPLVYTWVSGKLVQTKYK